MPDLSDPKRPTPLEYSGHYPYAEQEESAWAAVGAVALVVGLGLFCGVIQSLGNLNAYMFGRPPVLSDYVPILCVIAASLLTGVALRHRPRRQKLAAGLLIGAGVDILLFGLCFVGPNYSA